MFDRPTRLNSAIIAVPGSQPCDRTGMTKSVGNYSHGTESGVWFDYHENGQLAACGEYVNGKHQGVWRFWDSNGTEESSVEYRSGEEIVDRSLSSDAQAQHSATSAIDEEILDTGLVYRFQTRSM